MVVLLADVSLLLLTVCREVIKVNVGPPQLIEMTGTFLLYLISPTPPKLGLAEGSNVSETLSIGANDVGGKVDRPGDTIGKAVGCCDADTGIGIAVCCC